MRKLMLAFLLLGLLGCTYPTYTTVAAPEPAPAVVASEPEPAPAPVIVADPWALYVIDAKDGIVFEDHCLESSWLPNGWGSRENYRQGRHDAFYYCVNYETWGDNRPYRLVEKVIWYPGCGL